MNPVTPSKMVIVADDSPESQYVIRHVLESEGYRVLVAGSGSEALVIAEQELPDALVVDVVMPGMDGLELTRSLKSRERYRFVPVIMVTGRNATEDIVKGLDCGADDYLTKPYQPLELIARLRSALRMRDLNLELLRQQQVNQSLASQLSDRYDLKHIVGESPRMKEVFSLIAKVVDAEVPVLISGASGTGKELVARAIHFQSRRAGGPFIVKNCAGFQENLADAELFGYTKGAFTGAYRDHRGLFQAADGGTIFLDEIGEMPLSVQGKLLRVLQEGRFLPVGGTEERQVNTRLIAATNRDLQVMVGKGSFREDLFYRIHVINISLPTLSERREDIPALAQHFLSAAASRRKEPVPHFQKEVLQAFSLYSWRGNVRELQNEVERMMVLGAGRSELGIDLVSFHIRQESETSGIESRVEGGKVAAPQSNLKVRIEELEKSMIREALNHFEGNRSRVAQALGISRSSLISKIKEYRIED